MKSAGRQMGLNSFLLRLASSSGLSYLHTSSKASSCFSTLLSQNYTSAEVLEALGSVMTNKYSEGLPGQRSGMRKNSVFSGPAADA